MPVGLYRGEEGWVQVDYRTGATIPIPRSKYEANGYKPDFDKLPLEAEYWAAEKKEGRRCQEALKAKNVPHDSGAMRVTATKRRHSCACAMCSSVSPARARAHAVLT
jgi:hypothetical protein